MPTEQNHWEDNGLNWTAVGALRLAPQALALEAVRKAVAERCAASGLGLPAVLAQRAGALQPMDAFVQELQSAVDGLIPRFVDHHDHGGDWAGLCVPAQAAPAWTEARLLSQIGASARLPCPAGTAPLTTAWLLQQRLLLNELLWTKKSSITNPYTNPARLRRLNGSQGGLYLHSYDYPETMAYCVRGENPPIELFFPYAAANWDGQGWCDSWTNSAMAWEEAYMQAIIFGCRLERSAKTYQLDFAWPKGPVQVEHYAYLRNFEQSRRFDPSELGYPATAENTLVKTFSGTLALNGVTTLVTVGGLDTRPFWPPTATGVTIPQESTDITDYSSVSWELAFLPDLGHHDCVLKFDCENGFAFV